MEPESSIAFRTQYLQRLLDTVMPEQSLSNDVLERLYDYFKEIINFEAKSSDLSLILKILWKTVLNVEQLKEIKIGKLVNLVKGEERFEKEIRRLAFALVNRWKEMV